MGKKAGQRVKSLDAHPSKPWILVALYSGKVFICNYKTRTVVRVFEVTRNHPVRAAKFITREQWVITGSDDRNLRVYNYETGNLVTKFCAHQDYIRSLIVHPSENYVLSSSDDMLIKLWDWNTEWSLVRTFQGHCKYVMMIALNPRDPFTFASASLDKTIKVWKLESDTSCLTLEEHESGVNCVDFFIRDDKPYLISGSDDRTIRIWDYKEGACIKTLRGHKHFVTFAYLHPDLPYIISGSEDKTVRYWDPDRRKAQRVVNYNMKRLWASASCKGSNIVALGCDEGIVLEIIGNKPSSETDMWVRHSEVLIINTRVINHKEF